ncbi:MAG: AbrB/MazE/SpoVT family DNA-binding domain-containing protein [Candidatus Poribacteria bacterium]
MLAKLSSKGQLVIPKAMREALGLSSGTRFDITTEGNKIILSPIPSPIDSLYGKYSGSDFLSELEEEHLSEIKNEEEKIRN